MRNCIKRYFHTIRKMKAHQVIGHISENIKLPTKLPNLNPDNNFLALPLRESITKNRSYLGQGRFRFLNCEQQVGETPNWDFDQASLLWQYNLHYFDYLRQPEMDIDEGLGLIESWIAANKKPGGGCGWDPYPTSLRIDNWIKLGCKLGGFDDSIIRSLNQQAAWLLKHLEFRLMGNHLWANGKALLEFGIACRENRCLARGVKIVSKQLEEQFLPDGGHFELSPMYHCIVVEDLLDLINFTCHTDQCAGLNTLLIEKVGKALGWIDELTGEAKDVPLLNDSAIGIAPQPESLFAYANRLGVKPNKKQITSTTVNEWQVSNLSGYQIAQNHPLKLIFDTAPMGPDCIPGHAHCDMLSILAWHDGHPIFTDTGVYEYEEGDRRTYCRSTKAHNTACIDDLEQGDIWKSFRLGLRGYPDHYIDQKAGLTGWHSGFHRQNKGVGHKRRIVLLEQAFVIEDILTGPSQHSYEINFHIAPGIDIEKITDGYLLAGLVLITCESAAMEIGHSEYYPEFGVSKSRKRLIIRGTFHLHRKVVTKCISCS